MRSSRVTKKRIARDATLIETCKINDMAIFAYIETTLSDVADDHPHSRINERLPRNFTPPRWTDVISQPPFNCDRCATREKSRA